MLYVTKVNSVALYYENKVNVMHLICHCPIGSMFLKSCKCVQHFNITTLPIGAILTAGNTVQWQDGGEVSV